jgi:cystathionine beta-lyase/cystathionine gamma-synthase
LSVGVEHVDDLIADLDHALSVVVGAPRHVEAG